MATAVTDLLERAEEILDELRQATDGVTRSQWESFDQTLYRLLNELVTGRTGWRLADPAARALQAALRDFPQPLQVIDERPDVSIREAAQFMGASELTIRTKVLDGTILAAATDTGYRIPVTELGLSRDTHPATIHDPHPLSRLACTLGALSDVLTLARREPAVPELRADSAVTIASHALRISAAAARRTLGLCDPAHAERPLLIARYAAAASDRLPQGAAPEGLQNPSVPSVPHSPGSTTPELEEAVQSWAKTARDELRGPVPSVEVLKDVNRQSIHLYAALDEVLRRAGHTSKPEGVRDQIKASALQMQACVDAWSSTVTGASPSRAYVDAARRLYTGLAPLSTGASPEVAADHSTYRALLRGAHEAAWLQSLTMPWAARLLDSDVLFINARSAVRRDETIADRLAGRMVAATLADVPKLPSAAWMAAQAADRLAGALPAVPETSATSPAPIVSVC